MSVLIIRPDKETLTIKGPSIVIDAIVEELKTLQKVEEATKPEEQKGAYPSGTIVW